MKKIILTVIFAYASIIAVLAQNMSKGQAFNAKPGSANTISLNYSFPGQTNPTFSASANSNSDLTNGIAYNNGNAISYSVSSGAPYMIQLYAENTSFMPSVGSATINEGDMRNYIYYNVTSNTTGGAILGTANRNWQILGTTEKTIITDCQPTKAKNGSETVGTFSLNFKAQPGYSLSPGNYVTGVIVTATYE